MPLHVRVTSHFIGIVVDDNGGELIIIVFVFIRLA